MKITNEYYPTIIAFINKAQERRGVATQDSYNIVSSETYNLRVNTAMLDRIACDIDKITVAEAEALTTPGGLSETVLGEAILNGEPPYDKPTQYRPMFRLDSLLAIVSEWNAD